MSNHVLCVTEQRSQVITIHLQAQGSMNGLPAMEKPFPVNTGEILYHLSDPCQADNLQFPH